MAGEFGISMLTERLMPDVRTRTESSTLANSAKEAPGGAGAASFKDTLTKAIGEVNQSLEAADKVQQAFAGGKNVSLHEMMISMEKAEVSLRTVTAVRNKVVEAYQEIMRMQV